MVNSGASEFYNEKGIEIAKISLQKYPNLRVKSTLGRHPLEAVENLITKENYIQKVQSLKQQYSLPRLPRIPQLSIGKKRLSMIP